MCDEMERSLHDALCVVKRVLESKSVVPGGGAVEAALSIYLENYATSMVSPPPPPTPLVGKIVQKNSYSGFGLYFRKWSRCLWTCLHSFCIHTIM